MEFVSKAELRDAGCTIKHSLYAYADKNDDGLLNQRELRKASEYIVKRRCLDRSNEVLKTIGNDPWKKKAEVRVERYANNYLFICIIQQMLKRKNFKSGEKKTIFRKIFIRS